MVKVVCSHSKYVVAGITTYTHTLCYAHIRVGAQP